MKYLTLDNNFKVLLVLGKNILVINLLIKVIRKITFLFPKKNKKKIQKQFATFRVGILVLCPKISFQLMEKRHLIIQWQKL